jgi:hypothetical protein
MTTMHLSIVNNALHLQDTNGDHLAISFQRTLRIPDDGRSYPLPPGLGNFPLRLVRDYAHRVPAEWAKRGGIILPMYQREAMWLAFSGTPHALKVGVGKVCAISGEPWSEGLRSSPQDYVVTGTQPWLDGIAAGAGTIRQFVAMPLGMGYTVEGQITGEERHGGVQLQAYAPKPGRIPRYVRDCRDAYDDECCALACDGDFGEEDCTGAMGIAAGGSMVQKIYPDPYGLDTWELATRTRVFVHIVNSDMWRDITGEAPPPSPVSARSYAEAGLPWFQLYDEGAKTISPTAKLAGVKSIKQIDATKSKLPLQSDKPVAVNHVKHLWKKGVRVDDGEW